MRREALPAPIIDMECVLLGDSQCRLFYGSLGVV